MLAWQDYIQHNIAEAFAETGITLELTTFGSNDEAESTIQANGGRVSMSVFSSRTNARLHCQRRVELLCRGPG